MSSEDKVDTGNFHSEASISQTISSGNLYVFQLSSRWGLITQSFGGSCWLHWIKLCFYRLVSTPIAVELKQLTWKKIMWEKMNISEESRFTEIDWLLAVGQLIMQTENDWILNSSEWCCFQYYTRHERQLFIWPHSLSSIIKLYMFNALSPNLRWYGKTWSR